VSINGPPYDPARMRPERADIAAPEFPGRLRWLNAERKPVMSELTAAGPVLVHFFDFAQLNSLRALPYAIAWDDRYRDAGLTTLGIHSPRFPFTAERDALGPALERLGVCHPVADDSRYGVWHDYGAKGWPSLFLWSQIGALRWFHFGEGEYLATEEAVQDELRELDPLSALPAPLEPLRPSDAPGAMVAAPTEEVFPGGGPSEPWLSSGGDDAIDLEYAAAGAHASVAGSGRLTAIVDGDAHELEITEPGLVDLAVGERHASHRLRLEADPGVAVYSLSFSAGPP
jgi:hypothetical protein